MKNNATFTQPWVSNWKLKHLNCRKKYQNESDGCVKVALKLRKEAKNIYILLYIKLLRCKKKVLISCVKKTPSRARARAEDIRGENDRYKRWTIQPSLQTRASRVRMKGLKNCHQDSKSPEITKKYTANTTKFFLQAHKELKGCCLLLPALYLVGALRG